MLRVVIAALLAVALLAASQPAIERSRVGHAHARVADELSAVRTAIEDLLVSDDPVPVGAAGARRTLWLRLPGRSWASSGLARVTLGPRPSGPDRLRWQVRGGRPDRVRVPVDVRRPGGGPLVINRGGRHRLVLRLVRVRGEPAVTIRRPRFIPEGEATPAHVRGRRLPG